MVALTLSLGLMQNVGKSLAALTESADLIAIGRVIRISSEWKDDHRGRHIYSQVALESVSILHGVGQEEVVFEIVGGTVEDITETVSHQPSFECGEEVVVFLKWNDGLTTYEVMKRLTSGPTQDDGSV